MGAALADTSVNTWDTAQRTAVCSEVLDQPRSVKEPSPALLRTNSWGQKGGRPPPPLLPSAPQPVIYSQGPKFPWSLCL